MEALSLPPSLKKTAEYLVSISLDSRLGEKQQLKGRVRPSFLLGKIYRSSRTIQEKGRSGNDENNSRGDSFSR